MAFGFIQKNSATLAGCCWGLSFLLSLGTVHPLEIERLAAVVLAFSSLVPLVACGPSLAERRIAGGWAGFLLLLFWVLVLLSCAWSVAPPVSLIYGIIFSVFPATALALLLAEPATANPFLRAATWITGAGLAGLGLWPEGQRGMVAPLFFGALFLLLNAFLGMGSRAASLVLLAGLFLFVFLRGRGWVVARRVPLFALGAGTILLQAGMALLPGRFTLEDKLGSLIAGHGASVMNRFDIWGAAWRLIEARPWLGTGYGTFFLMYPSVRPAADIYSGGYMVHSDPLQFWVEMGFGAPLLFYAVGVLILVRFIAYWRGPRKDTLLLALFLGCAGFVVHAQVDFPFYAMPLIMVFGLALGVLLRGTEPQGRMVARPFSFMAGWPCGAQSFGLCGPCGLLLLVFAPLMLGEYHTVRADRMLRAGNLAGFGVQVNAAHKEGLGLNDKPYLQAATVPLGILEARAASLNHAEKKKLFQQADHLLSEALMRNSRLAAAWQRRGRLVMLVPADIPPPGYPDAGACFVRALSLDPLFLTARLSLARLLEARGDLREAFRILMDGVQWPYRSDDAGPYYRQLARMAKALRHTEALPRIQKYQTIQAARVEYAKRHRQSLAGLGLSTGN